MESLGIGLNWTILSEDLSWRALYTVKAIKMYWICQSCHPVYLPVSNLRCYHSLAMLALASPQIYFKTYVLTWMFHVCKRCEVGVYGTVSKHFFPSPEGYELALSSCLTFFFQVRKCTVTVTISWCVRTNESFISGDSRREQQFKSCMFSYANITFFLNRYLVFLRALISFWFALSLLDFLSAF